jgi:uncharacterized protein (TIGR00255 family)
VARGTISLAVRFTPTRSADFYEIDTAVLRKYFYQMKALSHELQEEESLALKDLLVLPGVVLAKESVPADKDVLLKAALAGLARALDQLEAMREEEGVNLQRDFLERRKLMAERLERVKALAPGALVDYQKRLEERVRQLLSNHEISLSPEDIIKEVAIVAERSDISEEIARMESHLEQFQGCLVAGGALGRKLEFLIQEMFRESNTMASKSLHPEMNRILVDIKTELDRLKEQVQNIE